MTSKQITEIPRDPFAEIRDGDKIDREASVIFDSDGCDVCRAVLSHVSFLVSRRYIDGYTIAYCFVAPNFDAFSNIVSKLEANDLKPKILEVAKFK